MFMDRRLKCPCLFLHQRTARGWYLITLMSNRGLHILLIGSLFCVLLIGKVTRPDPKTFHLLFLVYHFSNCSAFPSIYLTQKSLECYSPLSQKHDPSSGLYLCLLAVFFLKAMASHSSTLAWKIPWIEEPGRLQSMGLRRVRHDWVTSLSLFTFMHWRRK